MKDFAEVGVKVEKYPMMSLSGWGKTNSKMFILKIISTEHCAW